MVYMERESDLHDFSDPDVRLKYVPQLGCSVGGAISMLRKSWKSYKAARREDHWGPRGYGSLEGLRDRAIL